MIHIVKGFGIVNKSEVDVLLEFSCFIYDPTDVDNLISGSSFLIASPGSMQDTVSSRLVHWDDPEGWYGEGGGKEVQDGKKKKRKFSKQGFSST